MKLSIFLSLLFISNLLLAQNDTIVKFYDNKWKEAEPHLSQYYSVAIKQPSNWRRLDFVTSTKKIKTDGYYEDGDLKTKTGSFRSYYPSGKIESYGNYKQNKKIGVWKRWSEDGRLQDSSVYNDEGLPAGLQLSFHLDGKIKDSIHLDDNGNGISKGFWPDRKMEHTGRIVKGQRSGKWTYYYDNGQKSQEVYFQLDSAIQFTCYDEKGDIQEKNCFFERESEYPGGQKAWFQHIASASNKYAPKEFMSAQVNVQFVIDEEGRVTDISIKNSTEPTLNDAAIQIIGSSRRWIPAIQYNRKVKSYKTQPIMFRSRETRYGQ